jgi:nitroreductase
MTTTDLSGFEPESEAPEASVISKLHYRPKTKRQVASINPTLIRFSTSNINHHKPHTNQKRSETPMELTDAIKKRVSIRAYTNHPVPRDIITDIITQAHLAPSAGNLQARDFIIVDDPKIKERLSRAALDQDSLTQASYDIVVCANTQRISTYGCRGTSLFMIQDVAAAVEHILLLATDHGLGSCWVGAFDEDQVSTILNLPDHIIPQAIIPIGHPAENGSPHQRHRLQIHWNEW